MFDVEKMQRQLGNNGGLRIKMSEVNLLSLTSILLKQGAVEKTEIPA